ncbi:hypothetical protein GWK47_011632 [Chionoecetes opilio]|uniref:Uncharacterized protein n=1 Tax=Chionoecetes opilio TaxID=41210 RepID=A0A8J4XVU2_CHIOP|nr:hypothetical protein GWK47_011632 [Chionoecetes opilio]
MPPLTHLRQAVQRSFSRTSLSSFSALRPRQNGFSGQTHHRHDGPLFCSTATSDSERLLAAKKDFQHLLQEGDHSDFDSCWASLSIWFRRSKSEWRGCGCSGSQAGHDCGRIAKPDFPHVLDFHSCGHGCAPLGLTRRPRPPRPNLWFGRLLSGGRRTPIHHPPQPQGQLCKHYHSLNHLGILGTHRGSISKRERITLKPTAWWRVLHRRLKEAIRTPPLPTFWVETALPIVLPNTQATEKEAKHQKVSVCSLTAELRREPSLRPILLDLAGDSVLSAVPPTSDEPRPTPSPLTNLLAAIKTPIALWWSAVGPLNQELQLRVSFSGSPTQRIHTVHVALMGPLPASRVTVTC